MTTPHTVTINTTQGDSLTLFFSGGDCHENIDKTIEAFRAANAVTQCDSLPAVPDFTVTTEFNPKKTK